uniref:Uncharacterized protein n=1 Tax=Anguilla anguilla TaxID=7936 RepID=A0A0E9PM39_ANGAN
MGLLVLANVLFFVSHVQYQCCCPQCLNVAQVWMLIVTCSTQ